MKLPLKILLVGALGAIALAAASACGTSAIVETPRPIPESAAKVPGSAAKEIETPTPNANQLSPRSPALAAAPADAPFAPLAASAPLTIDPAVTPNTGSFPSATLAPALGNDPSATAQPKPAPTSTQPLPDWERELRRAGIYRGVWKTDFSRHTVPYREIFSGGVPRDGIPPLDNPNFTPIEPADAWLEAREPVIAFELNGEAKAYPLQILTWHEIVNDTVGGVPVAATFCPLCNSAIVFDRTLEGKIYDFGVSGNLRNSDLIMWDRQTESWWQQLTGEAIVGEMAGLRLPLLPSTIVAWEDFKAAYPDGLVLSKDTGFMREYGQNPYVGYDQVDQPPFLFFQDEDDRLLPMVRVAALTVGETAVAFPFPWLESQRVVHYAIEGLDLAVFFKPGARSALDDAYIADSKAVGATGVFSRELDGQTLTFTATADGFMDAETASQWNILGQATKGPMAGRQLTPVVHANHFWFAWAAFRPDTKVIQTLP